MATGNMAKFQRELKSLEGLAIMNIVFGGLAMGFAISIVVPNAISLVQAQSLLLHQLALAAVGFLAAAISIRWLISSAEMLDSATEIGEDYAKKKTSINDEDLTGLIVRMVAHYRENKPTIKAMTLISRIVGACFMIGGTFSLATAIISLMTGAPQWDILLQVLGTALSFAMATASFAIPHFFSKYSKVWDYRLEETAKAEKEFKRQVQEE